MKTICLLLLAIIIACAPNPQGLTEGMWARHKITGDKVFLTMVSTSAAPEDGGRVQCSNEDGDKYKPGETLRIFEFEPWDMEPESIEFEESDLVRMLKSARKAYESYPTPENHEFLGDIIHEAEVFTERKWNPVTERYENERTIN